MSFHRIIQQDPITLSDDKVIPAHSHICAASYETSRDPDNILAQNFDGFRYYKLRQQPGESQKYQFSSIDRTHLHFGAGFNACPGRWLASNLLKMIIGLLLLRYEFKFCDGQGRPEKKDVDEFIFTDPKARVMKKTRV